MAIIKNNDLGNDNDIVRGDRTFLMQTNIDTYEGELGIAGDLLTWAQGCNTRWVDACADRIRESGESTEAFQEFQKKLDETIAKYQDVKDILWAIIRSHGMDDNIVNAYGISKPTPRTRHEIIAYSTDLIDEHKKLSAAGDPRVVPQPIMDGYIAVFEDMNSFYSSAISEQSESRGASSDKQKYFDEDTANLRIIYTIAKQKWGDDDPKLRLLGFCPSSEVWTKDKPPHPTNFAHDGMKFSWDAVVDVDNYEIDYRLTGASGDWTQLYKGADTSTPKKPPDPGEYDFRIRSWKGDDSGAWSGVIVVNFHNGALVGVPKNFKFDDVKQEFSWDYMELALLYELEISRDNGQTWVQKYKDIDEYFNAGHLDTGKALARVRALDGYQEPGEWTDPLEVTFVLLAPAFVAYSQYKNEFIWNWVPLATRYELEISPDGMNWTMLYDGPNNHVVKLVDKGDWKVRARAIRDEQPEVFSEWSKVVPVNIVYNQPGDLSYKEVEKRIVWDPVQGAVQYQLMNESRSVNYIGADNHFDIELTGQEKFRVRAGDGTMLVWGEWTKWIPLGPPTA